MTAPPAKQYVLERKIHTWLAITLRIHPVLQR